MTDASSLGSREDAAADAVGVREQAFWDAHVPSLENLLRKYHAGPDANTRAMLDAVEPVRGRRVLDFACGAGVTAAFLAQRGAIVTAIDISPASVRRGQDLAERVGLQVEFVVGELTPATFPAQSFDAIVGHHALHHVDLNATAPIFNDLLAPGGRGGFVETMGLNPLLNFFRNKLAGRAGVASYGSEDERPLQRSDLSILERWIGPVEMVTGEMRFLRIFDRNVLRYRWPLASKALAAVDDALQRAGAGVLSYHQVVKLTKRSLGGFEPPA
jgi:SAM-dependent methyltransferase